MAGSDLSGFGMVGLGSAEHGDELRSVIDYHRSIVDFETVQEAPLR